MEQSLDGSIVDAMVPRSSELNLLGGEGLSLLASAEGGMLGAVEEVEAVELLGKTESAPTRVVVTLLIFTCFFHFAFYGYQVVWSTQLLMFGGVYAERSSLLTNLFDGILYGAALAAGIAADAKLGHYSVALMGAILTAVSLLANFIAYKWIPVDQNYLVAPISIVTLVIFACGIGLVKSVLPSLIGSLFLPHEVERRSKTFSMMFWAIQLGALPAAAGAPILLMNLVVPSHGVDGWWILFVILGGVAVSSLILLLLVWFYVRAPPIGYSAFLDLVQIIFASCQCCCRNRGANEIISWRSRARQSGRFSPEQVGDAHQALSVMKMFFPIPFFYAAVFLIFGVWVIQAEGMDRCFGATLSPEGKCVGGYLLPAAETTVLNFLFDVLFQPILTYGCYPLVARIGIRVTDLRKISAGVLMTAFSLICSGIVTLLMQNGPKLAVYWIIPQYALLSLGECLLISTAFEFAYTQAPPAMKAAMTGVLLACVSLANFLLVGLIAIPMMNAVPMLFALAGIMLVVFAIFIPLALRYQYLDQR